MYLYLFNNNFFSNPNVINAFTIVSKRFLNPLKLLQILKNLITCEPKTPIIELIDTCQNRIAVIPANDSLQAIIVMWIAEAVDKAVEKGAGSREEVVVRRRNV